MKLKQLKKYYSLSVILSVSLITSLSSVSYAKSIESLVEALDQKQKILERKWELQEEKNKEIATAGAGKEGFFIKSGDGKYQLKFKALVQADGRFFINQPQSLGANTFVARRVRPILEGSLSSRFDFKIVPDFGNGSTSLLDAYADVKFVPFLKLRGGKFKAPVGLERLQSVDKALFTEFGLPTSLVPNRDVGFQLFGDISDGLVSYSVGLFNGVSDGSNGDVDTGDAKDIAGRIFVKPFLKTDIDSLKGLGVGVSGTYGKQSGSATAQNLPTYKTAGQQTFFRYINAAASGSTPANVTVANGNIYRYSPQTYYSWGPFGFLGEYVLSSQKVNNNSGPATIKNRAWQTAASYVLTGENASYNGVKPRNPFKPSEGHWGAFELAARYNELRVDKDAFPLYASPTASARRARGLGGGVNWYLNDNVKFVADFENTSFQGGATTGNRKTERLVETRLQLAF